MQLATPLRDGGEARMTKKSGETIDVARVISTGQDRETGHAILRFRAEDGRLVALRLRPQQFRFC